MDCVKSLFLYDATLLSVVCRLFSRYKEGSIFNMPSQQILDRSCSYAACGQGLKRGAGSVLSTQLGLAAM